MSGSTASNNLSLRNWIAVTGVALCAFMVTIDITISGAAIKDIQATLGATMDEMSWLSTAYLVAEFIATPLTGWLSDLFSARRLSVTCIIMFVVFSIACGMSRSLQGLIFARFLQGFFGGIFIPLASNVVLTVLPPAQRPLGILMISSSFTLGACFGTTVGGYITENFGWSLSYYMNIIPGLVTAAMVIYGLDSKPFNWSLLKKADWLGIITMSVGLMPLIFVLEEGNRLEWFSNQIVVRCSIVSALGILAFLIVELKSSAPLINLKLFARRNFMFVNISSFVLGVGVFGTNFILPLYLLKVQRYNSIQTGLVMMWFGLPQLIVSPAMSYFIKKVDLRVLIFTAFAILIYSYSDFAKMTNLTGGDQMIFGQILRAVSMSLMFSPIMILAFVGIEPKNVPSASAIVTMTRILGGSVGVGILDTILTHRYQFHFSRIVESIPKVGFSGGGQQSWEFFQMLSDARGERTAIALLDGLVERESQTMAFADTFLVLAAIMAVGLIAVVCVRKGNSVPGAPAGTGAH